MTLPDDTQRMLVVGRTGSGKTQFGMACLAHRSYTTMPWIIMNFKDDELINEVPAVQIPMKLPKKLKPGLYVVRPGIDDEDAIGDLMRDIWTRTHVGLYVDEGLPISQPKQKWYRMLLTQGRSRRCPVVTNTQRPVDLDRYAFSESEFIAIMSLSDDREPERIRDITGLKLDMSILPKYHAYYFDRPAQKLSIVQPVPSAENIIDTFRARLATGRRSYVF